MPSAAPPKPRERSLASPARLTGKKQVCSRVGPRAEPMVAVPKTFPCQSLPGGQLASALAGEAGGDGMAASALDAAGPFSQLWEHAAGKEESA
jgi:hypothetical protein